MARDDSDQEEECLLSAEDAASDDDESYDNTDAEGDSGDDDSGNENEKEEEEDEEEKAPSKGRPAAKPGLLHGRPPRPPGAALPRPGARRPSLAPSFPMATRPVVSRLREDGDEADDDETPTEAELQKRREENIRALVNNSLQTCRQPLMSKFLSVMESQVVLRKPFQSPVQGAPRMSDALRRKLAARRHFVPWGSSTPLPIPTMSAKPPTPPPTPTVPEPPPEPPPPPPPEPEPVLPEGIDPLVLWQAPPGLEAAAADGAGGDGGDGGNDSVVVDPMLVRFLRPHQREGVQFMFDCVTGQRLEGKQGCILADDMGLGKTLQGITLLWTLLTSGHSLLGGCPIARRAIIVCPTSLVSNWDNECTKWLQGRLKTLAMCESTREDVVANIGMFLHPSNVYKVLIISYETFRMHAERLQVPGSCDLLVCDEAHRLKNDATLTNRALDNLPCKRRVLLSGTPMQNHLDEFFAMVDFCNPGVLGAPTQFRKYYELPILAGREPDAAPEQVVLGEERSRELSGLTNNFILRRTNKLLSQHLPPKVIEVVCCRLTELQRQLYHHFLQSKAARRVLNGRTSGVLSAITSLKKLCNHPKLIYDAVHSKAAAAGGGGGGGGGGGWEDGEGGGRADGFEDVGSLFPPGLFDNGRVGRGGMAAGWETLSGKMAVLARMLHVLYTETHDRIVLVSNYTSSLDLFAQLCRERGYPFVRLDGTTTINKRQKLVKVFNDPAERQFAFLLSSKAGGCGLNLIGANRLVLFDPDWNPANDQQAAARVWRDGQRKRVFVYRFLSTGSIEEKVYQRQLSKEGLKQLVSKNGKAAANVMAAEDLRELFRLNADSWSDTYDYMCGGPGLGADVPSLPSVPAAAKDGPIDLAADDDGDDDGEDGGDDKGHGRPCRRAKAMAAAAAAVPATGGDAAGGVVGRLPPVHKRQSGEPAEEDLANWGHHPSPETVPDAVMRRVAAPDVSFIFSCCVAGKAIEGGDEEERRLSDAAAAGAAASGAVTATAAAAGAAVATPTTVRGQSARAGSGVSGGVGGVGLGIKSRGTGARASTPLAPGSRTGIPVGPAAPLAQRGRYSGGGSGMTTPRCTMPATAAPTPSAVKPSATTGPLVTTPSGPTASPPGGRGPPSSLPPVGRSVTNLTAAAAAAAAAAVVAAAAGAREEPRRPPGSGSQPPPRTAPPAAASAPLPPAAAAAAAANIPTRPGATAGVTAATAPRAPSGAIGPTAAVTHPIAGSGPQPQPAHGSVVGRKSAAEAVSGGGSGGGSGSKPSSSVTGALVSSRQATPAGSGTSGRTAAATAITAGGAKPASSSAASAGAANVADSSPAQPLRSSAGPNIQLPLKPSAPAPAAAAAGCASSRSENKAAAAAGPKALLPATAGTAASAGPVAGGGGAKGNVRGRAAMEAAGGDQLEPPKPKRQRAPGWYIDSDDDDFL